MSSITLEVTVAHSRSALTRVVAAVYDRGWTIDRLVYTRDGTERRGTLELTLAGGSGNLSRQLGDLIDVVDVKGLPGR